MTCWYREPLRPLLAAEQLAPGLDAGQAAIVEEDQLGDAAHRGQAEDHIGQGVGQAPVGGPPRP